MGLLSLSYSLFLLLAPAKANEPLDVAFLYELTSTNDRRDAEPTENWRRLLEVGLLRAREQCLAAKADYREALHFWAMTERVLLTLSPAETELITTLRRDRDRFAVAVRAAEGQAVAAGGWRSYYHLALEQLRAEREGQRLEGISLTASRIPGDPFPTINHDPRDLEIDVPIPMDDTLPIKFRACFPTMFEGIEVP